MAHDVEIRVEIRDRAAGIEPIQLAAAGFGRGVDELGQIHHSHAIPEIIYDLHKYLLMNNSRIDTSVSRGRGPAGAKPRPRHI
jgi:hypothetical protein